jgi:hypothetical protein
MRRPVVVSLLVVALAACGTTDASPSEGSGGTVGTLAGVGRLPEPLTELTVALDEVPSTTESTIPRSTVARDAPLGIVGERVEGNRLIMIGDSITASTARRYGGEMCFTLLPLGWAVEVNAEVARFVDFGTRVLDRRLRPDSGVDWDAAVVFLGSNYGGDAERYRAELHDILDRLAPRPTVLVTVTEFRTNRAEVNEVIRGMIDFYPEVQVLDWAEITGADRSLLSGDGLHLSPDGRARLAGEIALALGPASETVSGAPVGECLSTSFTDDSAGQRPGAVVPPTLTGSGGGAGRGGANAPATTALPNPGVGSETTAPAPVTVATTVAISVAPTAPATSTPTTSTPTTAASTPSTTTPPTAVTLPPATTPVPTDPPAPPVAPTTEPTPQGSGDG